MMQVQAITTLLFPAGGLLVQGVQIAREEELSLVTSDDIVNVASKAAGMVMRELSDNLPDLSHVTLSWLTQYKKGCFEVYVDTSALDKEVKTLNRFGRQAVIALMLVGLIIGSAITVAGIGMTGYEGPVWEFLGQVAILGYVFSAAATALFVLRLLWRWLSQNAHRAIIRTKAMR